MGGLPVESTVTAHLKAISHFRKLSYSECFRSVVLIFLSFHRDCQERAVLGKETDRLLIGVQNS